MTTNYRRTNDSFAQVLTSRTVSVSTAAATRIIVTSGSWAMEIYNVGPSTIVWGDSNITASTGGILYYSMAKEFKPVQGDFEVYLRADSVAGMVSIQEIY